MADGDGGDSGVGTGIGCSRLAPRGRRGSADDGSGEGAWGGGGGEGGADRRGGRGDGVGRAVCLPGRQRRGRTGPT